MNLGQIGEEIAAKEYEKLGYKIIGRNVRLHQQKQVGEIDIVAESMITDKNKEIVFIEVKTRRSEKFGTAAEAVNISKQRKLIRACKLFLLQRPQYDKHIWRIDVVVIDIDNLQKPATILVNAIEDY